MFDFHPVINVPLAHLATLHRSLRRGDGDGGRGGCGGLLPVYTEEHLFFLARPSFPLPSLPSLRVFHPVLCPCFGKRKADWSGGTDDYSRLGPSQSLCRFFFFFFSFFFLPTQGRRRRERVKGAAPSPRGTNHSGGQAKHLSCPALIKDLAVHFAVLFPLPLPRQNFYPRSNCYVLLTQPYVLRSSQTWLRRGVGNACVIHQRSGSHFFITTRDEPISLEHKYLVLWYSPIPTLST